MKKSISRFFALLMVLLISANILIGCSGTDGETKSTDSSSSGSNEVTVYAAFPDYELPTYFNAFEADTGIKVNYVRLSSGEMLARIESEKDNPNASVMYGGSSDIYYSATENGLLEPYQSSELENVDDRYKDTNEVWNPISTGVIAFACNSEWFEKNNMEYPTSWYDLLDPVYEGQVSMSHPATAGTGYAILAGIMQLMGEEDGWEYLENLSQNIRQFTSAGGAPASDVGLGEAAVGIVYAQNALSTKSEGYPIELSFPKEGTQCDISGTALIKNGITGEEENAKALIDWLVSKTGQEKYIDSKSYRTPVNREAEVTSGLPDIDSLTLIDYDAVWAADNMTRLNEEFSVLINSGDDLKE